MEAPAENLSFPKRSWEITEAGSTTKQHGQTFLWNTVYLRGSEWTSQVALVVKNLPANAGDRRDLDLIPGSGRSSGEGNGNPLQYSCRGNPVDRRAWWASLGSHRVKHKWSHLARRMSRDSKARKSQNSLSNRQWRL